MKTLSLQPSHCEAAIGLGDILWNNGEQVCHCNSHYFNSLKVSQLSLSKILTSLIEEYNKLVGHCLGQTNIVRYLHR